MPCNNLAMSFNFFGQLLLLLVFMYLERFAIAKENLDLTKVQVTTEPTLFAASIVVQYRRTR